MLHTVNDAPRILASSKLLPADLEDRVGSHDRERRALLHFRVEPLKVVILVGVALGEFVQLNAVRLDITQDVCL